LSTPPGLIQAVTKCVYLNTRSFCSSCYR